MTRDQAIEKIIAYLREHRVGKIDYSRLAFEGDSPLRGALLMLEALELVRFDDEKPNGRN